MSDETQKTVVENIPSVAGEISAVASANAPFIYFEDSPFFGLLNGVGKVSLTVSRQIASDPERKSVLVDRVIVASLVGNIPAIRSLRGALDGILLICRTKAGRSNELGRSSTHRARQRQRRSIEPNFSKQANLQMAFALICERRPGGSSAFCGQPWKDKAHDARYAGAERAKPWRRVAGSECRSKAG
jgi:hypothetical protein